MNGQIKTIVRDIINEGVNECNGILNNEDDGPMYQFVVGFRRGLRTAFRSTLKKSALIKAYGKAREKEDDEYLRKKVRPKKVRGIKGEIHAITSVVSLIDEAVKTSSEVGVEREKVKQSLLRLIATQTESYRLQK